MVASGSLYLGVLFLVTCLGNENEVKAAPAPDPCNIFVHRRQNPTEAPKAEVEKTDEKEQIKFRSLFEEFLQWGQSPTPKVVTEPPKPQAKSLDMNTFFSAYIEFLTKFFNMF